LGKYARRGTPRPRPSRGRLPNSITRTASPSPAVTPAATCPLTATVILGTSLASLLLTKRRGVGRAG